MADPLIERFLAEEGDTERFGNDLAQAVRTGDVIALQGDLGAGKTTLARSLIRSLADDPFLEVPSPTFTLVQFYETPVPVAHYDLYRLSSPDELSELGVSEAMEQGIVILEWPERAEGALPRHTIHVALTQEGDGRRVRLTGPGEAMGRIERSLAKRDFLVSADRGDATRRTLSGDASARSYELVERAGDQPLLLIDSPPLVLGPAVRGGKAYAEIAHTARTVAAFVGIDKALGNAGFTVPAIDASNLDAGLLLVKHLGDETLVDAYGMPVLERYIAAAELLADMHGRDWSYRIEIAPGLVYQVPPFDRDAMLIEAELLIEWYLPAFHGRQADDGLRAEYRAVWNDALDRLDAADTTLMLRDVQSPNFIWRPDRTGHDRLGLIDFQDALIGPPAYDVASLALDPRVTIAADFEEAIVAAYLTARRRAGRFDEEAFAAAYAIMGAQRHSKILGIFVRLDRRDGKPRYLSHLPRLRAYLWRLLTHPALAGLRAFYRRHGLLDEASA